MPGKSSGVGNHFFREKKIIGKYADRNQVTFIGRLGANAEAKTTPQGKPVTAFRLMCSAGYGDKLQTVTLDCSWWGDHANMIQYLTTGRKLTVFGRFDGLAFFTRKSGEAGGSIQLTVNDVDLGEAPRNQDQQDTGYQDGGY